MISEFEIFRVCAEDPIGASSAIHACSHPGHLANPKTFVAGFGSDPDTMHAMTVPGLCGFLRFHSAKLVLDAPRLWRVRKSWHHRNLCFEDIGEDARGFIERIQNSKAAEILP